MRNTQTKNYKWTYLPFIFSSAAILASSVTATPYGSQQVQPAKQVNRVNHEYVGGNTQLGVSVTDDGDVGVDVNQVISESQNSSTSVGLWGDFDIKGEDKGLKGRGAQVNHNWYSSGRVNKVTAAYDRNASGHDKATLGYGQETEAMFWEGHVSKGLSGRKALTGTTATKAYDYGVGGSVGTFIKDSNMRVRAGLDHEWSNDVGNLENDAKNTTLSAGIDKFFQGTPHSLGLDIAASKKSGGLDKNADTNVNGRVSYRYDFGGASIYQPDRRYKRVRVEVPGKAIAPRYKSVPTYAKKTIKKPYKQLVKSTVALEGQTFFKLNSAKLIPSAQARLKQIASKIRSNGYKGSIRITGNTCGLGDPVYDQRLSEQRARAVRAFLINNGFNPDHLAARGLGKGHPKYPNTPEHGFKNRRVDIEYVSERQAYKTGYRTETQNVQTGTKQVLVSSGQPGTPRVIWKTEVIPTPPAWIKRAMHNNIRHNRSVNTFTSTNPTVTPIKMPYAKDDSVTLETCSTTTINVLANDNKGSGNATVTIASGPSHGTALVLANGTIKYTPDDDYVGSDSFQYTITDSNGNTSTATVNITVTDQCQGGNQTPTASDDSAVAQCDAIIINALGNDYDPDGDALSIVKLGNPSLGIAVIRGNKVIYTPVASCGTGIDTFSYTISDGYGHEASATIRVDVQGDNGNNQINVSDDKASTQEGKGVTIDVLANDDSGLIIVGVTPSANSYVEILNGKLAYLPKNGYSGTDSFTYSVKNAAGKAAQATVTVTVQKKPSSVNKAPDAVEDAVPTTKDKAIIIDVLANDTDPENDALSIISVTQPPGASTATISNGKIIFDPKGVVGSISFSYTLSDGHGNTADTVVTVGSSDPGNGNIHYPTVINDVITTKQGVNIIIDVLANDTDDDGDTLTLDQIDSGNFGETHNVGNKILYKPIPGRTGTDTFYYGVHDGHGHNGSGHVTVHVIK